MVSVPELPPSPGGSPGRAAARPAAASFQPARYVHGLLLSQGLAWLVLAVAALAGWTAGVAPGLSITGGVAAMLWAGLELLGIAVAACIGAAEIAMACRLAGGPRLLLTMAVSVQGLMLATGLIMAAFLVMVAGGLLELMALGSLRPRARRVRRQHQGVIRRPAPTPARCPHGQAPCQVS
jgi:hypothetical protein